MVILPVLLLSLGIAGFLNVVGPKFAATTYGAKLQASWYGMWFSMAIIILVAIYLTAFLLGAVGRRSPIAA